MKLRAIPFTKMHGIGNDYVYVNGFKTLLSEAEMPVYAEALADRHKGVGGDGMIVMVPATSQENHCGMRMFNADGSEGKMCGNGVRCVAKLFHDNVNSFINPIRVETLSGVKIIEWCYDEGVFMAKVNMGAPDFNPITVPVVSEVEFIDGPVTGGFNLTAVSMGNPHGVIFIDTPVMEFEVERHGRPLEVDPMWPDRANIEFARVLDEHTIEMRVWERGSGETMACGTGACATAVAAWRTGRAVPPTTIRLRGGDLLIDTTPEGHVMMSGSATTVFTGIIDDIDAPLPL